MIGGILGLKPGVPVLKDISVEDKEEGTTNSFYLIKLVRVYIESGDLKNAESLHLFTKKEIHEASVRYFCDCNVSGLAPGCKPVLGYYSPITYTNKHGALTTRFYTEVDCAKITGLKNKVYGLLFTAREMKRSIERAGMYCHPEGLMHRLKGVLMKFKRCLFAAIFACIFTGCASLVYRPEGVLGGVPYACTRHVSVQIADAVAGPIYGSGLYSYRGHLINQFMLPWLIVDLPCEVVADTLCLPVDIYLDKHGY